ncbi:MAG: hypothetical protein R6U58_04910 [Bacteroidales bacterium]
MKNLFSITVIILIAGIVLFPHQAGAQAPEKLSYQAVIRDAEGNLVTGQVAGVRIRILQGSADGAVVYSETQTTETNANGLVTVEIGGEDATVETGVFSAIDWSAGPFFIETGTDPSGGTDYSIAGVSQLLSVPYALHSKTAETVSDAIVEEDPVFAASPAASIEAADIAGWDEAHSWGDHAQEGYLTDYTVAEEDVTVHQEALQITEDQITDLQDYLTEESDPVFAASPAAGIADADIANWDAAFSDRLKWDGGSDGINATDGRTSLGLGSLAVLDQVPDESIEAQQLAENSVNRDIAAPDITNYLVPVGTIVMWSGAIEEIPDGWLLCDGTEGTPDLRGRFIVGYDSEDGDYNVIGAEGGSNTHTLTSGQMPEHNHTAATSLAGGHTHSVELTTSSGGSHSHSANTSLSGMTKPMRLPADSYRSTGYTLGTHSSIGLGNNQSYTYNPGASTTISPVGTHVHDVSGDTDDASDHTHTVTIENSGGGESFDKRPPYFVLAYIIKIDN